MSNRKKIDLASWFRTLRPIHWIKNVLIFFPIAFAGELFNIELLTDCFLGFVSFSMMASAVYFLNDIFDRETDQLSVSRKDRPIASGVISVNAGIVSCIVLSVASMILGWWLSMEFVFVLIAYLVINIAYSWKLKQVALIDVTIIAIGFLLRIFSGGVIADIPISHWLILMTFLLAFSLALGKRRYELNLNRNKSNQIGMRGYTPRFIDLSITLICAVTIVSYILYTISPDVVSRIGSDYIYMTSFPVLLGFLRYLQLLMVYERPADPVELVLKDHFLLAIVFIWAMSFFVLIYY